MKKIKVKNQKSKLKMISKKEKRGWILIVEAVIAVLILFGFLFMVISKQAQQVETRKEKENFLYALANTLVQRAEDNETIRNAVLQENCPLALSLLTNDAQKINKRVSINVSIEGCPEPSLPQEKEIYTSEIIICSNSTYYEPEPKKLRVYVWQK